MKLFKQQITTYDDNDEIKNFTAPSCSENIYEDILII